jgi:hypothetical protein
MVHGSGSSAVNTLSPDACLRMSGDMAFRGQDHETSSYREGRVRNDDTAESRPICLYSSCGLCRRTPFLLASNIDIDLVELGVPLDVHGYVNVDVVAVSADRGSTAAVTRRSLN